MIKKAIKLLKKEISDVKKLKPANNQAEYHYSGYIFGVKKAIEILNKINREVK